MSPTTRLYHGPNILAPYPLVVIDMPVATAEALVPAEGLSRLAERSTAHHDFLPAYDGAPDLAARLDYAAAWVLEALNFVRGAIEGAGARVWGDRALLYCGFHQPDLTRRAFDLALRLSIEPDPDRMARTLASNLDILWQATTVMHPDYQTEMLIRAARTMGLPDMRYLKGERLWFYGQGARGRLFSETLPMQERALANEISQDKRASKKLMRSLGLPVCDHLVVRSAEDLARIHDKVPYPCIVKPLDRGLGVGLTANIRNRAHLEKAYDVSKPHSGGRVLIEPYVEGDDYRIGVHEGRYLYAVQRTRREVVGDGERSIRQMIEELNVGLTRNLTRCAYYVPIKMEDAMVWQLERQGVTLDTVLAEGHRIRLSENGGLGAPYIDVTDKVHPDLIAMSEECAASLGYQMIGLDYRTTDITRPPGWGGGAFLEYNCTVGIVVPVRAGWSVERIGRLTLGEGTSHEPGRIETVLHIVPEPSRALEAADPPGVGHMQCSRQHLRTVHRMIPPDQAHPWATVLQALRRPDAQRLEVFASPRDITRHGFPLDRFTRIEVPEAALPEPWHAVARQIADAVTEPARPGA